MMWLSDMHTDTPLPPVPPPPTPTVLGYPGHVAYSYKGILFSHKKKWNSDRQTSTTWINERNERWKNWKNEVKPDPRRTNVAWLHLCGAPRAGDFREKEGDGMLVRPVQRGNENWSEVKWKLLSHVQLIAAAWAVHGILQARILEWVAFAFSRGSSQPRDRTQVSCI